MYRDWEQIPMERKNNQLLLIHFSKITVILYTHERFCIMGKGTERSDRFLLLGTIPAFQWKTEEDYETPPDTWSPALGLKSHG
jgi:hypothetical protein